MSQIKSISSEKEYDYLVMIGRFQPFHNGHLQILTKALEMSENVIILLGSAESARNIKNPFSDTERYVMIAESVEEAGLDCSRIQITRVWDNLYNLNAWIKEVQEVVDDNTALGSKIGIIGHMRDKSSFYLEKFPQWGNYVEVGEMANNLNATSIREHMFNKTKVLRINREQETVAADFHFESKVPKPVAEFMKGFLGTEEFKHLLDEYLFIKEYKKKWEYAPYAPTFVTADSVVVKNGHVLLVERDGMPGKGLWALPGGFISPEETIYESALRELREETRLKVPRPVLDHANRGVSKVFDNPSRSLRGRTITHAFYFNLDEGDLTPGLPKVKGSDDAKRAFWVPFREAVQSRVKFYEDHFHILSHFLNK